MISQSIEEKLKERLPSYRDATGTVRLLRLADYHVERQGFATALDIMESLKNSEKNQSFSKYSESSISNTLRTYCDIVEMKTVERTCIIVNKQFPRRSKKRPIVVFARDLSLAPQQLNYVISTQGHTKYQQ